MYQKQALVVGGTSGLGLAFVRLLREKQYRVFATGRHDPKEEDIEYISLSMGAGAKALPAEAERVARFVAPVDILIHAAGYLERGRLGDLSDDEVLTTLHVNLSFPVMIVKKILSIQKTLPLFVAVTSTSQWVPRKEEPVYASTKAGLGMLARSLSYDEAITKTLVVAPAGMQTRMQAGRKDLASLLDPTVVAQKTFEVLEGLYTYREVRILRDPVRIEILEER